MEVLKISSKSNPNSVAGAMVVPLKEKGNVELHAVGAAAINQAVKSIAIVRGFMAPSGANIVCIPAFIEVDIEGMNRTGIKFIIKEDK